MVPSAVPSAGRPARASVRRDGDSRPHSQAQLCMACSVFSLQPSMPWYSQTHTYPSQSTELALGQWFLGIRTSQISQISRLCWDDGQGRWVLILSFRDVHTKRSINFYHYYFIHERRGFLAHATGKTQPQIDNSPSNGISLAHNRLVLLFFT